MEEAALNIYLEDAQRLFARPGFDSKGLRVKTKMPSFDHAMMCKCLLGHSAITIAVHKNLTHVQVERVEMESCSICFWTSKNNFWFRIPHM